MKIFVGNSQEELYMSLVKEEEFFPHSWRLHKIEWNTKQFTSPAIVTDDYKKQPFPFSLQRNTRRRLGVVAMPISPTTWEAEIRKIIVQSQPRQKLSKTLISTHKPSVVTHASS
jgi:hypothetical protein